jgi:aspartate-semialdehyde dehydrogenase
MSSPLREAHIGVIGATGAVGTLTLRLLAERGYRNVRAFASPRSAGKELLFGDGTLVVEEATPEALRAGDLDLCLFSVGTSRSKELVPHASAGGAICIDKSSAYRLVDGYPLVVPEVNGTRALEALERDRIIANPNCCAIPLTTTLKPLHDAAGLKSVHVATYQSVSGAGAKRMAALEAETPAEHNLTMDWSWEGEDSDEESKLRQETQKILELPELPLAPTCVRVPVLVGHSEAIWIELEDDLSPEQAAQILRQAPSVRVLDLPEFPTPKDAAGGNEVLVGRIRRDPTVARGLSLYLSCDNLRKGAALNALQIAELVLQAQSVQV